MADLDHVVVAVPGLQLEVMVADPRWSDLAIASLIEPMLAAVVAEFEDPLGSACLALSNDDHVHQLNKQFRGMDNLLGFDHTTSEEAEEMEALERGVLASLGIPDPYDDETFELG